MRRRACSAVARLRLLGVLSAIFVAACAGSAPAPEHPAAHGSTGLVYHADFLAHDMGPAHPERPDRLRAVVSGLERAGLSASLAPIAPRMIEDRWITTVHTPAYLASLEAASAKGSTYLDADTAIGPHSLRIARLAAGGVLAAVDAVASGRTRNAFAAVRPPGHHALPARAMGFCIFNSIALAARYAQARHGLARVLIVDWDAHHGNGTQEAFYDDPSVMFFSTHESPHYPFTGHAWETGLGAAKGTTINVALRRGAGDREVIDAFHTKLVPAADAFRPDMVLISAGFDGHARDPLSGLGISAAGYAALTRIVMDIDRRHAAGRVVSMLEGGYNLDALSASVNAHVATLMGRDTLPAPVVLPAFSSRAWRRGAGAPAEGAVHPPPLY